MVHIPGKYNFKFEVYPLTVKGLDFISDFTIEVKADSLERKQTIQEIEKKDNKLKIEPSLFQKMLANVVPTQEDQEIESDDEDKDDSNKKTKKDEEGKLD